MAENKKSIDVIINTASAAKSVGELKKALKELSFAQENVDKSSPDFSKLTDSINEVEGRIGDLNDAFKTFTGSGVERLSASTNLLQESFSSLDFGKLKVGLQGLKQLPKALAGDIGQLSKALSKSQLNFKTLGGSMKELSKSGVGELTKSIIQLGKAILTNPLLLLAAVIVGIVAAVVKFYDKIKPVKALVELVGEAIDFVIQKLKDFADWLGITSFAAEEAAQKQLDTSKKLQQDTEKRYDNEIKLAQAAGKDTYKIEKEKQEAVRESLKQQIDALMKFQQINGKLTDDQIKNLEELKEAYSDSLIETKVLDAKKSKEVADQEKKDLEDRKKKYEEYAKAREAANESLTRKIKDQEISLIKDVEERELAKATEDNKRAIEDINKSKASNEIKKQALIEQELVYQDQIKQIKEKADKEREDKEKEAEEKRKSDRVAALNEVNALEQAQFQNQLIQAGDNEAKLLEIKMAALQSEKETRLAIAQETGENLDLINQEFANKELELTKQTEEQKRKEAEQTENQKRELMAKGLDAAQSLTSTFFAIAQNQAKNDAKKQLELKKKQFNVDKAFNLVRATIDGVRSVQAALTMPPPASYALAAINGVMAAANIVKIASSKFDGGETAGGASVSSPTPSASSLSTAASAPSSQFVAPQFFGLGQGGPNGKQSTQKVVVVETDITKTQKRVQTIESRATQKL